MSELLDETNQYVKQLLEDALPKTCIYHNYVHTQRVYKSTKEIINHVKLSKDDEEVLLLAILFHDTGYINGFEEHEEKSTIIAKEFLTAKNVNLTLIDKICEIIMATKMESTPKNELEKIARDADASHFAKDYFQEASEYLRQELRIHEIHDHSLSEWREANIEMFTTQHRYYTDYAIEHWKPKKDENLLKMLDEKKQEKKEKKKEKLKAKLKEESPEKAIQSMYRITLKNHIKLSDIADTKANILLSVNAIIISVALSNLIPKLDKNTYLIIPTVIFVFFSIISMILSVLATRPNVTQGKFSKDDVKQKKVNLLFFGNFHKMSLSEFEWAINEMMLDKDYIYSSLTKDLYFLGVVLDRKYRILRITYTIFIVGIVLSAIAFVICFEVQQEVVETVYQTSSSFIRSLYV